MSSPITKDLLYATTRGITIRECEQRGWEWERYGWVRSTIKYAARQFSEGESIDKIIHWKNPDKTRGHNFDSLDTFAEAMHIAATEYGIENIPYKKAEHITPRDKDVILYWYEMGMSADTLAKQYGLLNGSVVEELFRQEISIGSQDHNQIPPIQINQYPHTSPVESLISSRESQTMQMSLTADTNVQPNSDPRQRTAA
jgi:hypothetical protein